MTGAPGSRTYIDIHHNGEIYEGYAVIRPDHSAIWMLRSGTPPRPPHGAFHGGLHLQVGANAGQSMYVYIEYMRAVSLGIGDSAIDTLQKPTDAIIEIDDALTRASEQRSDFGAYQNRLEHTLKSLEISYESISNAESRIGDADMAKEMMRCPLEGKAQANGRKNIL